MQPCNSCAKDPDALQALFQSDESFRHLNYRTSAFIRVLTKTQMDLPQAQDNEGEINMWPAIKELIKRGERRGERRGKKNGAREAQNAAITNSILFLLENNSTVDFIASMLTQTFELSSEEAMKRIQEIAKA